eukprot:14609924-Heterocapsa_arctica.AAC.1
MIIPELKDSYCALVIIDMALDFIIVELIGRAGRVHQLPLRRLGQVIAGSEFHWRSAGSSVLAKTLARGYALNLGRLGRVVGQEVPAQL